MTQLITLTTDCGEGSPYVAQMKAVVLTIHPRATYGDAAPGQTVALFGSSDRLEIAVTHGNAAQRLGAQADTSVRVAW